MAADPLTPFLKLYKPIVNDEAGEDLWGEKLNSNFDKLDVFASSQGVLNEAPEDGLIYGRQNRTWAETVERALYDADIGSIILVNDEQDTAIAAGAAAITVNSADIDALELALQELNTEVDGKIGEAPDDGGQYVRQSLAWQLVDIPEPLDAYTKPESDARYEPIDTMYTKAESDARYEPFDSAYTKAEADAKYLTPGAADTAYVNIGGDTMTGFLSLHADPDANMKAATKQYVDGKVGAVISGATVSDAPPATPVNGQFWLESDSGTLFVRWHDANSQQWVDVSGSASGGSGGGGGGLDQAIADTLYVNVDGDTMSGNLTITKPTPMIALNGGNNAPPYINLQVDGKNRWGLGLFSSETGGNVGSDIGFFRSGDDGVGLSGGIPLYINRATGVVTANGLAPTPQQAAGLGQFLCNNSTVGGALLTPAGGMWAHASIGYTNASLTISHTFAGGVAAGGTQVRAATAGVVYTGFFWRVA